MKQESEYFRISLRFVGVGVDAVRRSERSADKKVNVRELSRSSLRGKRGFADIAGTELVDSETPKRPDSTAARH